MMMQHYFDVFSITPTLYVPYGYRTTYEEAYPWNEYFKTVRES